jgi:hypothetical protein
MMAEMGGPLDGDGKLKDALLALGKAQIDVMFAQQGGFAFHGRRLRVRSHVGMRSDGLRVTWPWAYGDGDAVGACVRDIR